MIKLKSIIVIIVSCVVISLVLVLTVAGFSLYLGWKEKEVARAHSESIAGLNADLYGDFLGVSDLQAKRGRTSIYKDKYIVEGVIKNSGFRTISSVMLKVDFFNSTGNLIHTEAIRPLASSPPPSKTSIATLSIFTSGRELPLAPGQTLRFKHILTCQKDKDIVSPIKNKRFATNPNEWSGKWKHEITLIKF